MTTGGTFTRLASPGYVQAMVAGPDGRMWFTTVRAVGYDAHMSVGRLDPDGTARTYDLPLDLWDSQPGLVVGPSATSAEPGCRRRARWRRRPGVA